MIGWEGRTARARKLLSRASVVLLIGQLATAVSAFAMNLLSSNTLPPAERGFLAFFLQLSYIATVFSLLGVERPYSATRTTGSFGAAYRDLSRLTRTAWLGAVVLLGLATWFAVGGDWVFAGLSAGSALYMLANVSIRKIRVAYIVSLNPRPFLFTIGLTQGLLLFVGFGLFAANISSPLPWLMAYGATGVIAPLVAFINQRRDIGVHDSLASGKLASVRREGLRLLPASFGNTALLRSDRLLLPFLSTPAELGRYVAVATIMEVGTWPIQQWVDASLGKWRAQGRRPGRRLFILAMVGACAITLLLVALTYFVIEFWLPAEYRSSQQLLLPLAVANLLYAGTRIQQGLLIARGFPGTVSVAETSGLIVSLLFYVALIPGLGALGAALGSTFGYLALLAVTSLLSRRLRGRSPSEERLK